MATGSAVCLAVKMRLRAQVVAEREGFEPSLPHTAFPVRAKPSADVRPGLWREGIDPMVSAACRSRPPFLAAVAINVAFGAGQPEAGEAHLGILRISSHQTETEWRVVGMQAQGAVGGLPVAEPLGTLPTGRAALGHPRRHDRPRGPARARRLRTPRACSNRAGGRSGPCSRSSDDHAVVVSLNMGVKHESLDQCDWYATLDLWHRVPRPSDASLASRTASSG